jgi:hypothetical protein
MQSGSSKSVPCNWATLTCKDILIINSWWIPVTEGGFQPGKNLLSNARDRAAGRLFISSASWRNGGGLAPFVIFGNSITNLRTHRCSAGIICFGN